MRPSFYFRFISNFIRLCLAFSLILPFFLFLDLDGNETEASSEGVSVEKVTPVVPATPVEKEVAKGDKSETKVVKSVENKKPIKDGVKAEDSSGCLVSAAAIEDLQKSREELNLKQKDLVAKDAELSLREKSISEEMKKLEMIRDGIEQVQGAKKKEQEEKVSKLMETVLSMNPKSAAKLLDTVNDDLAVRVISQMDTPKLAKIMNIMEPARASRLSEMLTGVSKTKRAPIVPVMTAPLNLAEKGGEANDHKDERRPSDRESSAPRQPAAEISQPGKSN